MPNNTGLVQPFFKGFVLNLPAALSLVEPLQRQTLGERAYGQLAELLMSGRLAPGEKLSLRKSAEVLGVSMMPVRELPGASWQTALGLGFVSAIFDNIPLTALALKQAATPHRSKSPPAE